MATKKKSTKKSIKNETEPKAENSVTETKESIVETAPKKKSKKKNFFITSLLILAVLAIAAGGGLLYKAYTDQKERADRLANPTEAAKEESRQLIEKVGMLTDLPNEEPTIATVRDTTKLQDQSFFQNAQNGDKVLIYTQSRKAVLYRPSTNKIIEIAPVNLGQDQAGQPLDTSNQKPKSESQKAAN